ncbi:hypothetical protein L596_029486 [Steinernema carpocapsae]|uniref:DOMON domain-containing protein n=1 Tax=Steinernema carpocapsae TaxID=34508 RepID=A0A4U5LUS4_STECR|nr:hypothetical protein L596_029486 [Steinernema carpocapsae]
MKLLVSTFLCHLFIVFIISEAPSKSDGFLDSWNSAKEWDLETSKHFGTLIGYGERGVKLIARTETAAGKWKNILFSGRQSYPAEDDNSTDDRLIEADLDQFGEIGNKEKDDGDVFERTFKSSSSKHSKSEKKEEKQIQKKDNMSKKDEKSKHNSGKESLKPEFTIYEKPRHPEESNNPVSDLFNRRSMQFMPRAK